jgi:glucose-1-phosphate adenylyltransferase
MKKTLAMILAGGKGSRLEPLTTQRAKPAVPFGGKYRIIDFVMSNMINSGISNIVVLSQHESRSLEDHIRRAYTRGTGIGQSIYTLPPRSGEGKDWYKGTADAIAQNIDRIEKSNADRIAIFGGDHIYKMDISKMIDFHNGDNDLSMVALKKKITDEDFEMRDKKRRFKFGVIITDKNYKVKGFQEKPQKPTEIQGEQGYCWVSMGNYVFNTDLLLNVLNKKFGSDFGNHVIPKMKEAGKKLAVFPFDGYWRDVGDLDSYYNANMDLNKKEPELDIRDANWPILTLGGSCPPTRHIVNSTFNTIAEGCDIRGTIENCILSPYVTIGEDSIVKDSIILNNVEVGNDVRIKDSIIDKLNHIPSGSQIGYDSKEDRSNGYRVTKSGIRVVPRKLLKKP